MQEFPKGFHLPTNPIVNLFMLDSEQMEAWDNGNCSAAPEWSGTLEDLFIENDCACGFSEAFDSNTPDEVYQAVINGEFVTGGGAVPFMVITEAE